jgi:hypothetical protein
MRRTLIHLLVSASMLGTAAVARGADGPELTPLVEPLPMPAQIPVLPEAQPIPVGMGFSRPNRLDVWQNLAVDRFGRWRPRVALFSDGSAYYPNGVPYPFLSIHPRDVMPYLFN